MNVLLMLLMMAGDPATCPMHAQHTAAKHTAVDQRGDRVMGFSHEPPNTPSACSPTAAP